jgi:transposase-like protein
MQLKTIRTYNLKQPTPVPVTDKDPKRPDPEVLETKPRRRFTAKYKLSILAEVGARTKPGEIGALLRREGLYSSNIRTWQRQLQEGALKGLIPKKRGRKKHEVNPLAKRVAELERDNAKLAKKLKQAETIIEVQKKISEILGISQPDNSEESS